MYQAGTPELRRIMRWLDNEYADAELRSVEPITKNAVRIVYHSGDSAVVVCRQDGTMDLRSIDEAC